METMVDIMPKSIRAKLALKDPVQIIRELNKRSLLHFLEYFWDQVSGDPFRNNWHIEYICSELEKVAERLGNRSPRDYDLIINVPPATTKTITVSIMFPVWCWTKWPWMKFVTGSYAKDLAMESAEYSRDIIRSEKFKQIYPDLRIKEDKDNKSNYKLEYFKDGTWIPGGNRFSTGVGGLLTGFHGHFLIVDDPLNPKQSASEVELKKANHWFEQTLSTRKADKKVSTKILIMQRLHQDDPTGHILAKPKLKLKTKNIVLPGEIRNYAQYLNPPELMKHYKDELLDPGRMDWEVLGELEAEMGQYGYSGQIGQNPVPPGGGMFKVDQITIIHELPDPHAIIRKVRYWDKAGTMDGGAYTAGVKMYKLQNGKYIVVDVKRGQWSTEQRERIIRSTAEGDGIDVGVFIEQEPGSGGKESAENTIRNLAGFSVGADKPTGEKANRADPYSTQVNWGNVQILHGDWNHGYIEELRFFPFGTYKDQVDASSGAFSHLVSRYVELGR